jgi:diguanylate cyclase (GGDEF)-like protein
MFIIFNDFLLFFFKKLKVGLPEIVLTICLVNIPIVGLGDTSFPSTTNQTKSKETHEPTAHALPVLSDDEKAWLAEHKEIKIALKKAWLPIEFIGDDSQVTGISVDILKKIEDQLNITFIKTVAKESLVDEDADMLSSIRSAGLVEGSRFTALNQPYLTMPYGIYVLDHRQDIKQLEDLDHKKIAVYKPLAVGAYLEKKLPHIELYKVDSAEEGLAGLQYGSVDAYVGNQFVINHHINAIGYQNVKVINTTPYSSSITMAVRDDWPELKSIIEKTLFTIGIPQMEQPIQLNVKENKKHDHSLLVFAIALFGTLATFLATRWWKLRYELNNNSQASEELIRHQANFDTLTELPNRRMFQEKLTESVKNADITGIPLALLLLDLDGFKQVNDGLGHTTGDLLLKEVANRLSSCLHTGDTVARLGGDEFTVILEKVKNVNVIKLVADKILTVLCQPFLINDHTIHLSASIGITLYPTDTSDTDTLLKNSDQAMYAAKGLGKNCYQFFTPDMQKTIEDRIKVMQDLRSALPNNEFELHYQPIIELSSGKTVKAEALIRWIHPSSGCINPSDFIPIIEESGLIVPIGNWAFGQAADFLRQIREQHDPDFQVSINVSPKQFQNKNTPSANEPPFWVTKNAVAGIVIEITESLVLDLTEEVREQLNQIRLAGIETAIDDFGTGYSSLAYLKKFEIDYIKIDRSFVSSIETNISDKVLCEVIVQMAHKLGFKVVAEGIETKEQSDFLVKIGCDYGQGYYFSKAIPESEFMEHLTTKSKLSLKL